MISILISSESRYPINRPEIKEVINNYFRELGVDDLEVSIAIVGSRKIRELSKRYRQVDEAPAVLTFSLEEPRDMEGILRLGDIVVSYPQAREVAQEENLTMNQVIKKLLIHGMKSLLEGV